MITSDLLPFLTNTYYVIYFAGIAGGLVKSKNDQQQSSYVAPALPSLPSYLPSYAPSYSSGMCLWQAADFIAHSSMKSMSKIWPDNIQTMNDAII